MHQQQRRPTASALRGFLFCAVNLFLLLTPVTAFPGGASPDPHSVGMRTFGVWEPTTRERFDFSVWYPSRSSASESVQEGWIVEAGKRGRIIAGAFPVVLISHDTAGGRFAHNDLAAALAAGGMIVIVPSHSGDNQNSGSGLYSAELLRDRPRQLLRALETVLSSPDFAPHVDESRIGLVGVGIGAVSVMQLAGAVPDFLRLEGYCGTDSPQDAFCARWVGERLARLPAAMAALEARQGNAVFSPALSLYVPDLVPVPVPPELDKAEPLPSRLERKSSLWQRLFGKDEEEEDGHDLKEREGASQEEAAPDGPIDGAAGESASDTEVAAQAANDVGAVSSEPESGAGDTSSRQRETERDSEPEKVRPEPLAALKADANTVYRRKPEIRTIRGIALMAPAGGMLFSRKALAGIHAPVAIIEAGQDGLYPPQRHARPYSVNLPVPPLVLQLPNVDHFSLFARCSKDTLATLRQICGRLTEDARTKTARERDRFLVSFFQSALGGMLPVLKPSGFAAAPPPEEQVKP